MTSKKSAVAMPKKRNDAPRQNPTSSSTSKRANQSVTDQADTRFSQLSAKAQAFTEEYLIDFNGARAARAAGYKASNARDQAYELLKDPRVQARVAEHAAEHSAKATATVDAVLDRMWAGANADAREFSELHRVACRYCYGVDHRYQWTSSEMDIAKREWLANLEKDDAGMPPKTFDERGGTGYSHKRDPHTDCPQCCGDGIERVIVHDTRDLSPNAIKAYAGVKTTQHGTEIIQHDPIAMLLNVGKHLGMFKKVVELSGKNGRPIQYQSLEQILDEIGAAGGDTGPGPSS